MIDEIKTFSKKRRPSISDFNKLLINTIENKDSIDKMNNSFAISSNNILKSIKLFNNQNKKLLLEKLDTSNFHKKQKEKESFHRFNTINYDNSEDLFMAKKLSASIMTEKSNVLINNNTKEKTNSTSYDNDIIEVTPLEIYNRKIEYLSNLIKNKSFWRKYKVLKKFKIHKFFYLINKIFYKNKRY